MSESKIYDQTHTFIRVKKVKEKECDRKYPSSDNINQ